MAIIKDQMVYVVVIGHGGGKYLPEQSLADMDRKTVVRDIAAGQYEGPIQVLEINPVEKICRDVTEDIAQDVLASWADDGEPLDCWQRDFLEQTIGIEAANAFPRVA